VTPLTPIPAVAGLVWAIVGPPLLVFAATQVRGGRRALHMGLMLACVVVELAVFAGFTFFIVPGPRRAALAALPFFKVHVAFAVTAFAGIAWQLTSRAVPGWRRLHRSTGPYVVLVWCVTLLTGIYNYLFLYVMRAS
jgi:uncharacterized membrane protein YozB (DUF420 family)